MEEDALLQAIATAPDDDTYRLIYTDWLEENGRSEEAEFIRLGCALAAHRPDHPDYPDWEQRHEELTLWLSRYRPRTPPSGLSKRLLLNPDGSWWQPSDRGFPRVLSPRDSNHIRPQTIRRVAEALEAAFKLLPTRRLFVSPMYMPHLADLLSYPVIEQVQELIMYIIPPDNVWQASEAARLLAASPRLRNLRSLSFYASMDERGAEALARGEHFSRLEEFDWLSQAESSPDAVRILTTAPWFRNLTRLRIDGVTPATFRELCQVQALSRLHTLQLSQARLASRRQGEGLIYEEFDWQVFAASSAFPHLARLELRRLNLGSQAATLFAAPWLRPSHLALIGCHLDNEGADALARSAAAESLRSLTIRLDTIREEGLESLFRSWRWTRLRHLDLTVGPPNVHCLEALTDKPAMQRLTRLVLNNRFPSPPSFSSRHWAEFLGRLELPELRHLSLVNQTIDSDAARMLTRDSFRSLRRLSLSGCPIDDATARTLLTAPALQELIELDLTETPVTLLGLEPLANPGTLPRLAVLGHSPYVFPDTTRRDLRPLWRRRGTAPTVNECRPWEEY